MIREIVFIDEEKCDGCGECVPTCHEGAIQIINGKARLVSDNLCDGLGACLGHCPQGAIRIERREATPFDEEAVAQRTQIGASGCPANSAPILRAAPADVSPQRLSKSASGCPSARFAQLGPSVPSPSRPSPTTDSDDSASPSALNQWPVQLRLLPPTAPIFRRARMLLCADCVPVALANFQQTMLRDHAIAIACPKLDDTSGYLEKLTELIRSNEPAEITVAHMEVPCCTGLLMLAIEARRLSGRSVPIKDVVVGTRGEIIARREIPPEAARHLIRFEPLTGTADKDTLPSD